MIAIVNNSVKGCKYVLLYFNNDENSDLKVLSTLITFLHEEVAQQQSTPDNYNFTSPL